MRGSSSLTVIHIGALYRGTLQHKYWSCVRGRNRFPYSVGFKSTRWYSGRLYEQEVKEGPHGPMFILRSNDGVSFSGDSPSSVWEQAVKRKDRDKTKHGTGCPQVNGSTMFGFDDPTVRRLLQELVTDGETHGRVQKQMPSLLEASMEHCPVAPQRSDHCQEKQEISLATSAPNLTQSVDKNTTSDSAIQQTEKSCDSQAQLAKEIREILKQRELVRIDIEDCRERLRIDALRRWKKESAAAIQAPSDKKSSPKAPACLLPENNLPSSVYMSPPQSTAIVVAIQSPAEGRDYFQHTRSDGVEVKEAHDCRGLSFKRRNVVEENTGRVPSSKESHDSMRVVSRRGRRRVTPGTKAPEPTALGMQGTKVRDCCGGGQNNKESLPCSSAKDEELVVLQEDCDAPVVPESPDMEEDAQGVRGSLSAHNLFRGRSKRLPNCIFSGNRLATSSSERDRLTVQGPEHEVVPSLKSLDQGDAKSCLPFEVACHKAEVSLPAVFGPTLGSSFEPISSNGYNADCCLGAKTVIVMETINPVSIIDCRDGPSTACGSDPKDMYQSSTDVGVSPVRGVGVHSTALPSQHILLEGDSLADPNLCESLQGKAQDSAAAMDCCRKSVQEDGRLDAESSQKDAPWQPDEREVVRVVEAAESGEGEGAARTSGGGEPMQFSAMDSMQTSPSMKMPRRLQRAGCNKDDETQVPSTPYTDRMLDWLKEGGEHSADRLPRSLEMQGVPNSLEDECIVAKGNWGSGGRLEDYVPETQPVEVGWNVEQLKGSGEKVLFPSEQGKQKRLSSAMAREDCSDGEEAAAVSGQGEDVSLDDSEEKRIWLKRRPDDEEMTQVPNSPEADGNCAEGTPGFIPKRRRTRSNRCESQTPSWWEHGSDQPSALPRQSPHTPAPSIPAPLPSLPPPYETDPLGQWDGFRSVRSHNTTDTHVSVGSTSPSPLAAALLTTPRPPFPLKSPPSGESRHPFTVPSISFAPQPSHQQAQQMTRGGSSAMLPPPVPTHKPTTTRLKASTEAPRNNCPQRRASRNRARAPYHQPPPLRQEQRTVVDQVRSLLLLAPTAATDRSTPPRQEHAVDDIQEPSPDIEVPWGGLPHGGRWRRSPSFELRTRPWQARRQEEDEDPLAEDSDKEEEREETQIVVGISDMETDICGPPLLCAPPLLHFSPSDSRMEEELQVVGIAGSTPGDGGSSEGARRRGIDGFFFGPPPDDKNNSNGDVEPSIIGPLDKQKDSAHSPQKDDHGSRQRGVMEGTPTGPHYKVLKRQEGGEDGNGICHLSPPSMHPNPSDLGGIGGEGGAQLQPEDAKVHRDMLNDDLVPSTSGRVLRPVVSLAHPMPVLALHLSVCGRMVAVCCAGKASAKERSFFVYNFERRPWPKPDQGERVEGLPQCSLTGVQRTELKGWNRLERPEYIPEEVGFCFAANGKQMVLLDDFVPSMTKGPVSGQQQLGDSGDGSSRSCGGQPWVVSVDGGGQSQSLSLRDDRGEKMRCLLVVEPSLLVAAGDSGCIRAWVMTDAWESWGEGFHLPSATAGLNAPPPCLIRLANVPSSPHHVLGCGSGGFFGLWDVQKRELLSTFFCSPKPSIRAVHVVGLWEDGASSSVEARQRLGAGLAGGTGEDGYPPGLAVLVVTTTPSDAMIASQDLGGSKGGVSCRSGLICEGRLSVGREVHDSATAVTTAGPIGFAGSAAGEVAVWDIFSGRPLAALNDLQGSPVTCVAANSGGTALATTTSDGRVVMYMR